MEIEEQLEKTQKLPWAHLRIPPFPQIAIRVLHFAQPPLSIFELGPPGYGRLFPEQLPTRCNYTVMNGASVVAEKLNRSFAPCKKSRTHYNHSRKTCIA